MGADPKCDRGLVQGLCVYQSFYVNCTNHSYQNKAMFSKLMIAAIATLATALPAAALPTYSSSAPASPTVQEVKDMDREPVLLDTSTGSNGDIMITHGTLGFLSTLESDGNLYVERIFISRLYERGVLFGTMSSLTVIDCGRMMASDRVRVMDTASGERRTVNDTPWRSFGSGTVFAKSCEAAASDRGRTWNWYAQ